MKVGLFGRYGQVATEVQRRFPENHQLVVIDRQEADFLRPESVVSAAAETEADAFINATAYTAVDQAEKDSEAAAIVNGHSVGALAEHCATRSVPLIHISTDYVFDGQGTLPHSPGAPTNPLGSYGRSKLLGEELIRASGCQHIILRTSWVFSAHGSNFVKTMLRLGRERTDLSIVADQVGGPTPAADIASASVQIAESVRSTGISGTYHFSGSPDVSWADFAREIFRQADLNVDIVDIPTTDYPTPTPRPLNSRLDCESLQKDFGIERPDWREGLAGVLKEIYVK